MHMLNEYKILSKLFNLKVNCQDGSGMGSACCQIGFTGGSSQLRPVGKPGVTMENSMSEELWTVVAFEVVPQTAATPIIRKICFVKPFHCTAKAAAASPRIIRRTWVSAIKSAIHVLASSGPVCLTKVILQTAADHLNTHVNMPVLPVLSPVQYMRCLYIACPRSRCRYTVGVVHSR
jgi:hypothetical protein